MRPLGEIYRANGSTFKVLKRIGDVAIAEETGKRWPLYEVFIVQKQKAGEVFGKMVEAKELPPSNGMFGMCGWQWPVKFKDKAWAKFEEEVLKRHTGVKERKGDDQIREAI